MSGENIWLDWAVKLQSIAQAGLTYGKDKFDIERYEEIRKISAEIVAHKTELPLEKVIAVEEISKLNLAEEKNNLEQIKMCFAAYENKNWQTQLD